MERKTRQYWAEQLSEYWGSGFSVREYCELKDLRFEAARWWVRLFKKEREPAPVLELVELQMPEGITDEISSGIRLKRGNWEVLLGNKFESEALLKVLNILEGR